MLTDNLDLATGFKKLISYCEVQGVRIALAGALAPAVLLAGPIRGAMRFGNRETRDADSLVELQSWEEWKKFIEGLVALGFQRDKQQHRLRYGKAEFDLVPYGAMVTDKQVLTWPSSQSEMNMIGCSDALNSAKMTEVLPDISLPVARLWSIISLKIAAYRDRRFPRDLSDIVYIADEFERSDPKARRYDVLGGVNELTFENAGAYLLGQDIKTYGSADSVTHSREFLKSIEDEYSAIIATVLREENRAFSDSRRSYVYSLFRALHLGIQ